MGSDLRPDRCGLAGRRGRRLAYPVLSADRDGGVPPAVYEPTPTPYRAKLAQPPAPVVRAIQSRLPAGPSRSRIRLHLKPGQKGTRQLVAKYGERLVRVRYRYDPEWKKRFKTTEIIVGERGWEPAPPRFADDQIVGVHVAFEEVDVRERVKQAGGTWSRPRRVWQLAYGDAVALGLGDRVVAEPASTHRCRGGIQVKMLASTARCRHLRADASRCSRIRSYANKWNLLKG